MEPLSFSKHARMLNAPMIGVLPVRAYVTVRHRNAWHGTESNQYRGQWALASSKFFAELEAESWRKSGSRFSIIETPALALLTADGALVCADFHRDDPFGGIDLDVALPQLRAGEPLASGSHAVASTSTAWRTDPEEDSLIQGVEYMGVLSPVDEDATFSKHSSVAPTGAEEFMGWSTCVRKDVRANAVCRIAGASLKDSGLKLDEVLHEHEVRYHARLNQTFEGMSSPDQER